MAYLESTSWVKNNCKGQSIEYSRAIPSQPSIDVCTEASDGTPESPSEWALALGNSTWEDLTMTPGILEMVSKKNK